MEEIKQGLKEPCFFISCINQDFRRYMGKRYLRQNQFAIQYFPESEVNANEECHGVAERMNWCLETIEVPDGRIHGTQMKYEVVDGVLNFTVNYDCFVYRRNLDIYMEKVKHHTDVKG